MHIESVSILNFKGARQVDIYADDRVNEVAGKNGAGKSSVLDAILAALAGTRNIDSHPLTFGATKGEVTVDLGDLTVTRRFTEKNADRGGTLTIKAADGSKWGQRGLDEIFGEFTFDPLAFSRLPGREQITVWQQLAGEEFCAKLQQIDDDIERLMVERRDTNRALKQFGQIPDVPKVDPVDTAELMEQLREAEQFNQQQADLRTALHQHEEDIRTDESLAHSLVKQISELNAQLSDLQSKIEREKSKELPQPAEPKDTEALKAQLAQAGERNAQHDAYRRAEEQRAAWQKLNKQSTAYDKELLQKRDEREQHSRSAQLPVEGLEWTADGITLHQVPFNQLSSSERLRISARIGMAMNECLRIMFIRDGSLLDDDAFAELVQLAEAEEFQLWVETVGKGHTGDAIVLEAGVALADEEAL